MLKTLDLYNNSEMKRYDEFVTMHPEGTFFHLSSWLKVIRESYSYTPFLYVMENLNGEISSIFPVFIVKQFSFGKKIVSLPFSDYGGPLTTVDKVPFVSTVLREIFSICGQIEVRSPLPVNGNLVGHCGYKRHVLDLSVDISTLKKNIDKKTALYSIRKAERLGVEVKEETTLSGLREFYRLNILTRRKHGVPVQPFAFFLKLYENLVQNGLIKIYIARLVSQVIGGGVFLSFKNGLYYKYNASDPTYLSKVSPNHAILWYVIQESYASGCQFIDFGRTSVSDAGLIRYKETWGAKTIDLPYFYSNDRGINMSHESGIVYRTLNALWRVMPPGVTDRIGPMIYRYLG